MRTTGLKGKHAGLDELCEAPKRAHGCIHPLRVWETSSHFTSSKTEGLNLKTRQCHLGTEEGGSPNSHPLPTTHRTPLLVTQLVSDSKYVGAKRELDVSKKNRPDSQRADSPPAERISPCLGEPVCSPLAGWFLLSRIFAASRDGSWAPPAPAPHLPLSY